MARIKSFSSYLQIPGRLLAPSTLVLTHNELLCLEAKKNKDRIGFKHGDLLYEKILSSAKTRCFTPSNFGFEDELITKLIDFDVLEEPYKSRLKKILEFEFTNILRQAEIDVKVVSSAKNLPQNVWIGTGGPYVTRVMTIEIMNRGGQVTSFSHGGTIGMLKEHKDYIGVLEYLAFNKYVVPSNKMKNHLELLGIEKRVNQIHNVKVEVSDVLQKEGKSFGNMKSSIGKHKRLMYVASAITGFCQHIPMLHPDLVYLDWQMRISEDLLQLPIDLICKPHPEGILKGQKHPLEEVAPTTYKFFEEVMGDVDVFLFDYPASTTFWKALCTDKEVIYIDQGITKFSHEVVEMIERRCTVINGYYNDRNLPEVDSVQLEHAVLEHSSKRDGSEFREIIYGC